MRILGVYVEVKFEDNKEEVNEESSQDEEEIPEIGESYLSRISKELILYEFDLEV